MVKGLRIPRVLIGGVDSGVGKTSITLAIASILSRRGLRVQTFKVGPDYIDPSYHTLTTGRKCRNLDSWMVPRSRLLEIVANAGRDADISIIEGVMGFYDGFGGADDRASTAEVARMTKTPSILIIDVSRLARSSAAIALGYKAFDRKVKLAGVLLNRVCGEKHEAWCREAIGAKVRIPVVGAIPSNREDFLEERHLGLIPTPERMGGMKDIDRITEFFEPHIDVGKIVELAESAPPLPPFRSALFSGARLSKARIGIAFDEAFNFYYQDNLDLLSLRGAKLLPFSPLHDRSLPEVDGIYLGGGFPEMLAGELESNVTMRRLVKEFAEDDKPLYAECGGLMYLTRSITPFEGPKREMVGFLDGGTVMRKKLILNYTLADVIGENPLAKVGVTLRGHEFHHSEIVFPFRSARFAYRMHLGFGIDGAHDGWLEKNSMASYTHLHFAQDPGLAERFVAYCCLAARK